jgi:hypothetical protein
MDERPPLKSPVELHHDSTRYGRSLPHDTEYENRYLMRDIAESLRIIADRFESLKNLDEFTEALKKWSKYFEDIN